MKLKLPKQDPLYRQVESARRKGKLNGEALIKALDKGLDKKQLHHPDHQKAVEQIQVLESLGVKAAGALPLLYREPMDLVLEVHPELLKSKWLAQAKPSYHSRLTKKLPRLLIQD